jgi:hypothetical protein
MTPLPPFAQMVADMQRLGAFGSRRGDMPVHSQESNTPISRLPLPPT